MPKKPVAVTLRKPQTPADVESFVGASAAAPASAPPANPIEAAPEVRHGARDYREMTVYLPTELVRELSLYCMDRNCDVNRVVADAVREHVTGAAPKPIASTPSSHWSAAVEMVVEQLRGRLSAIWALRP
jgi:hypothetical protein